MLATNQILLPLPCGSHNVPTQKSILLWLSPINGKVHIFEKKMSVLCKKSRQDEMKYSRTPKGHFVYIPQMWATKCKCVMKSLVWVGIGCEGVIIGAAMVTEADSEIGWHTSLPVLHVRYGTRYPVRYEVWNIKSVHGPCISSFKTNRLIGWKTLFNMFYSGMWVPGHPP